MGEHVESHASCCGGIGYCRECYQEWPCKAARDVRRVEVLDAVIEHHEPDYGTHFESCWKVHAGCLAHLLRYMEGEDGEQ